MMGPIRIKRRAVIAGAAGLLTAAAAGPGLAQVARDISDLQPGEFTWHPEREPRGGVSVVVSLPEQRVHVYRAGVRIAVSTCSTGKEGHRTPTGVFTILQKDADHRSSTYNNAPMPNMNRLTWDGIALHAGDLPGYPASHGCVRLPLEFSRRLFEITHIGTPVIIAGSQSDPWELQHPGMLLGGLPESEMEAAVAALGADQHPSDWPDTGTETVTAMVASSADRRIYVYENGREIDSASFDIPGSPGLGEHVLMLEQQGDRVYWVGITHVPDPDQLERPEAAVSDRIRVQGDFNARLRGHLHLGMTLVVTDLPTHPDMRSGSDFTIMTS